MRDLIADLRCAFRIFRHSPGFAWAAVAALALGIGINSAMFSIVSGVLLEPLGCQEPERVVRLYTSNRQAKRERIGASPAEFVDWRRDARAFSAMAAIAGRRLNLTGRGEPEQLLAMLVTHDFFALVGGRAALGRVFLPEEYEAHGNAAFSPSLMSDRAGASTTVVLSHRLWMRRFGGDPGVLGTTLHLDGKTATVVGVMPSDFEFDQVSSWGTADLWIPQSYAPGFQPRLRQFEVIARLRSGVLVREAQAQMDVLAARLAVERPAANAGWSVEVVPLLEAAVGPVRRELLLLAGAVGFVLLVACANTANLLLARVAGRRRELAVRASLGAGRGRLACQIATESLLLAGVAGAIGLALAAAAVPLLRAASPPELPRVEEIALDGRVVAFTVVVSVLTGLLCGVLPALRAAGRDLIEGLKEGGGPSQTSRRRGLAGALVVGEVALALVLLVGAGLALRTFVHLVQLPLGFETANVVNVGVAPSHPRYRTRQAAVDFLVALEQRVVQFPGIEAAGIGSTPFAAAAGAAFYREGGEEPIPSGLDAPTPGYFRALRTRLAAGRLFGPEDRGRTAPVAILNETAARLAWPAQTAVGRRITLERPEKGSWLTVVGVIEDVRHGGLEREPEPRVYVPLEASTIIIPGNLLVRARGDASQAVAATRAALDELDREQPLVRVATLESLLGRTLARRRFLLGLVGGFAALAAALAAFGIASVMAAAVAQRTREIGIRIALGADRCAVLGTILGQGLRLVLIGEAVGLAGALALQRVFETLVFGIQPNDPAGLVAIAVAWAAAALAACFIPARRALAVDPIVALRQE